MNDHYMIDSAGGWRLSLFRARPRTLRHPRPVLLVPGYGMNSFIFGFHPRGTSIEREFTDAGYEFWRVDLRGQGESFVARPGENPLAGIRLEDWATSDLSAAIEAVIGRSETGAKTVDVLGASLGGSITLAHAVLIPDNRLGAIVVIGSPLRWLDVNPIAELASRVPRLLGALKIRHTRALSLVLLPLLARFVPGALSAYLNPAHTDLSAAKEMVRTVEDPIPSINRQIAEWLRDRDLVLCGHNIASEIARVKNPLLSVVADGDGLVPQATARYAHDASGASVKEVLFVSDPEKPWGHADLFIANRAPEKVFAPVMKWLSSIDTAMPRTRHFG